jgi:hypothetical protein
MKERTSAHCAQFNSFTVGYKMVAPTTLQYGFLLKALGQCYISTVVCGYNTEQLGLRGFSN